MIPSFRSAVLEIAREAPPTVPYKALLEVYRQMLATERNKKRRTELEFAIVVLIGMIELQKDIAGIAELLKEDR